MSTKEEDTNLLLILLSNLRNTASTFGAESYQYESVLSTVREQLEDMRAAGRTTDLTSARVTRSAKAGDGTGEFAARDDDGLATALERLNLDLGGK